MMTDLCARATKIWMCDVSSIVGNMKSLFGSNTQYLQINRMNDPKQIEKGSRAYAVILIKEFARRYKITES